jgi:hypothetical protein
VRLSTLRADDVDQQSVGLFGDTEIEWSRKVRTMFGMRGDIYHWNVRSDNSLNSGEKTSAIVSPKVTAAFGPWRGTELYANWGLGFHSNSGLGVVLRVDPLTGEPADTAPPCQPQGAGRPSGAVQQTIAPGLATLTDDVLFGDVWRRPELSPRDRSLVTISVLIATGSDARSDHRGIDPPGLLRRLAQGDQGVDGGHQDPRQIAAHGSSARTDGGTVDKGIASSIPVPVHFSAWR